MDNKKLKTLGIFLVLFFVSLFLIFFVWKNNDWFFLTKNWVSSFKKWLDIAGWVKLTYKIDFSQYKKIYTKQNEFNQVKTRVEDIVLRNIDSRISKLWVSDYSSYIQTLNWEDYIIVEIGWIKDLEKAKEVIWKTVALEFKVPYDESDKWDVVEGREKIAEDLLTQVKDNPQIISEIWTWRESERIIYQSFSGKQLFELPLVYQQNVDKLSGLEKWEVFPKLLSWIYDRTYTLSWREQLVPKILKWWTLVKFNGKNKEITDKVDEKKLQKVADQRWLELTESHIKEYPGIEKNKIKYIEDENKIIYNAGEVFSWKKAFDTVIYKVSKPSFIWKSQEEINELKESKQNLLSKVKNSLDDWSSVDFTWVQLEKEWWMSLENIESLVQNFDLTWVDIKVYDTNNFYFVVQTKSFKDSDQKMYKEYQLKGFSSNKINELKKTLKTNVYYSFENIFVERTPQWIMAKDTETGRILNWAYFKYASVAQDPNSGKSVVTIQFNSEWKSIFCNLTKNYKWKRMAIFVGGELTTAPVIRDKICWGSAQIDWNFKTPSDAKELANSLNEWAFPVKLILSQEEKVSPVLWEKALSSSIKAWIVGVLLIAIFMTIFWWPINWLVSILSLALFFALLFGFTKLIGYAFSLSWIAAIILSIWMSVDSNILIFERVREEKKEWKSMRFSIFDGYRKSISAIRDGKLTTFMIAFILFMLWMNIFKWFGFMMMINIFLTLSLVPLTNIFLYLLLVREE